MATPQNIITTPGWTLRDAYETNNSGKIVGAGIDPDCALNVDCLTCYDNSDCSWPFLGKYCQKPAGNCMGPGRCEVPPSVFEVCAQLVVCGCDGTTYSTPCAAAQAATPVAYNGACCLDSDGDGSSPSGGNCGPIDCDDGDASWLTLS